MYSLNLDADGRILSVGEYSDGMEHDNLVESFPDDNVRDYKYINGEFIHDPEPKDDPSEPTEPVEYATYSELATAIKEGVNSYGR